jgi:hypothetical protein
MTVQAENDSRVGAWFDCHYANEANPDLELSDADEASTALAQMALGSVVIAVLFALSLAVWACGPLAFKGLLHAPNRVSSAFLLPHGPGLPLVLCRRISRPAFRADIRFERYRLFFGRLSLVEWTDDGLLRRVVCLGERGDKPAREVVRTIGRGAPIRWA